MFQVWPYPWKVNSVQVHKFYKHSVVDNTLNAMLDGMELFQAIGVGLTEALSDAEKEVNSTFFIFQ